MLEEGARADIGLSWTRFGRQGWENTLAVGRVFRFDDDGPFTAASGLDGDASDWLISGRLSTAGAIDLIGRLLLDEELAVTKNELRLNWTTNRLNLATTYAYLRADLEEDRRDVSSELALDTSFDLNANFTALADWRYDFNEEATTEAGLGLVYTNECVELRLSISRSFTSSASVSPSTEFGFTVGLRGFGTGPEPRRVASNCNA